MIRIAGKTVTPHDMLGHYSADSIEMSIVDKMSGSSLSYDYETLLQYKFELDLRASIISTSKNLLKGGMSFSTFRNSKCNSDFWIRTKEGGFLLKEEVEPWNAIRNIIDEGHKYATECATAIIIIYYGAIADRFTETQFNSIFKSIYLMNWKQLDRNLGIKTYDNTIDELPGDCTYFKNPDVNPLTPQWQGENAIVLGDGLYYGHGIGIKTAEGIISSLNKHRKSDASESAYHMNTATIPGFKSLAAKYYSADQYSRFQWTGTPGHSYDFSTWGYPRFYSISSHYR